MSEHSAVADECIDELVDKLVNVCKKNWEITRKRHEQASGSNSSISLNLRDMLKAHIAKYYTITQVIIIFTNHHLLSDNY